MEDEHLVCPVGNHLCLHQLEPAADHPTNYGDGLTDIDESLRAEFCHQSESDLLIDFCQHGAGDLLHHGGGHFYAELDAELFDHLVNGYSGQAGIHQRLHLITGGIKATHLCQASNHAHLHIENAADVCRDCHGQGYQSAQTG